MLEDETLPPIFLVSLDDSFDDCGTDAAAFFGEGGVISHLVSQIPQEDFMRVLPAGGGKVVNKS